MDIIKKYLPEIGAVLAIVGLLGWVAVLYLRLEAAHNETARVTLAFEQYKVSQQAEVQREQQKELERFTAALTNKETENETLRNENTALRSERDHAYSLYRTANANLRQARENADNGTCEQAREAARMCTDLYAKLEDRATEAERRVSVYAGYADRNVIELDACIAYSQD